MEHEQSWTRKVDQSFSACLRLGIPLSCRKDRLCSEGPIFFAIGWWQFQWLVRESQKFEAFLVDDCGVYQARQLVLSSICVYLKVFASKLRDSILNMPKFRQIEPFFLVSGVFLQLFHAPLWSMRSSFSRLTTAATVAMACRRPWRLWPRDRRWMLVNWFFAAAKFGEMLHPCL